MRRRVAFLRAARELLLRDLGGFVYELHRTAHDVEHEAHRHLRETKLARLSRVDAELHELEFRLDDVRRQVLVREPGVGGECPHCGELFGSAAHYCSNCGLPLTEGARRELARSQQPQPAPEPVIAPEAAAPPVVDQPTQEIPPLDPDHPNAGPDFQWPRREGDAGPGLLGAATPSAETSDGEATPEPVASEPEAATRRRRASPKRATPAAEPSPGAPASAPRRRSGRGRDARGRTRADGRRARPRAARAAKPATTRPRRGRRARARSGGRRAAKRARRDARERRDAAEAAPREPEAATPASEAAASEPEAATPAAEAAASEPEAATPASEGATADDRPE